MSRLRPEVESRGPFFCWQSRPKLMTRRDIYSVSDLCRYILRNNTLLVDKLKGKIMTKANECGCGRSVTGKCMGWHDLPEEKFLEKKEAYLARRAEKMAS